MPSRTDASMVTAFTEVITTFKTRGYHRALNVMDKKCSAAVEKYIRSEKISIQLVPSHNHRVNTAERAITTVKEHFITALTTVDMHCPLQLWDEFLPQLALDSPMPQPTQFRPRLQNITSSIRAPSLTSKNTVMGWCILSRRKPSPTTKNIQRSPPQRAVAQSDEQRTPPFGTAQGCTGVTKGTNTIFPSCTLTYAKSHRTEHSPPQGL
jgi:hypothetical protein